MTDEVTRLASFREEIADWIEAACPATLRGGAIGEDGIVWGGRNWTFANPDQKAWFDAAVAKGMTAPMWPQDVGGALGLAHYPSPAANSARCGRLLQRTGHAPPPAQGAGDWCRG